MTDRRRYTLNIFIISATVLLSLTLVSIPTDTITEYIGTSNVYLFMYLIAFVGSISTFASIPYPLFLISFVAGGFNPILLGLCSALGVITADSGTFLVVKQGRWLIGKRFIKAVETASKLIDRYPRALTPGLIGYGTFSPLSNDFAVVSFSLMHYRYREVILPLALGNIFYNIGVAYLGLYVYDWVVGLF